MYVWLYIVLASLTFDTSMFTKYSHMRRYQSSGSATYCMLMVTLQEHQSQKRPPAPPFPNKVLPVEPSAVIVMVPVVRI